MFKKIILAICLCLGLVACSTSQTPDVTFHTLDGKELNLSDLKGKVVYLKFWATSCTTCVRMMPQNIRDYEKYHDKGLETIAVAMSYDPKTFVQNFADAHQLPFIVALDSDGSIAKAFDNVRYTPVAFLIDKKGNIIKRLVGDYNHEEFIPLLEKALAE
ncbi:hypothetical protein IX83_01220 [Basilea psittacipulmonis DSM 24701]|uniref:Thioredoxin domain-containing protein n=2 Tax=Basilea TaxID=1472344 RepID=A0A077DD78_9BURK|nr:TlpA disulfide reductase family protein [Basilea psittacipulmonis]AIL32126.1 hypothetical protein IX83_01220 [Basilea psittacipulmonis DSM 24701]